MEDKNLRQPGTHAKRIRYRGMVAIALPVVVGVPMAVGYAIGAQRDIKPSVPIVRTMEVPSVNQWDDDALLPGVGEQLPAMHTEAFRTRIREIGLDPADVEMFAKMMQREGFQAALH
jgi:hypothetical protein